MDGSNEVTALTDLKAALKEILDMCIRRDPEHPHYSGLVVALNMVDCHVARHRLAPDLSEAEVDELKHVLEVDGNHE